MKVLDRRFRWFGAVLKAVEVLWIENFMLRDESNPLAVLFVCGNDYACFAR